MLELSSSWSLHTRVGLISTLATLTGLLFGSVAMYRAAAVVEDRHVAHERVERMAQELLASVRRDSAITSGATGGAIPYQLKGDPETGDHKYQVWLRNSSPVLLSHHASSLKPLMPLDFTGFDRISTDGENFIAYAVASQDREIVVQVAEHEPDRLIPVGIIFGQYFAFILIPLGLLLVAARILLRRSFHSLDRLSDNLNARGPHDVTSTFVENPPRELLPIISSLDSLFRRVNHALSVERRFTAVAAHELRTPLAGIRAQAQIAGQARDPLELADALNSVQLGVDKATRVIEQLIDLAKVESARSDVEWSRLSVSLSTIFEQVMDELGPKALAKNVELKVSFAADNIQGLDFAIYMLMRNLIANAILYCPEGGQVEARTEYEDENVILTIDDTGPGIPEQARESAFEKFNRLGKNGSDGVGLGLSIAAQVAELHRAKIELQSSPLGGLRAQVVFRPVV